MYDNRNYLDSSLVKISKWEDFNESLNYYLSLFNFTDATCLIREFINLEEYLNCEYNVNEREKNIYFACQEKLREYLNQNFNEKYFRLSQSTSLFEELKTKLDNLLKRHLTNENLNDVLHKYNQLLANYESLFDKVKSKVKVRKSKYEGYLQTWREFDLNCEHLYQLFDFNSPDSLTNLEFSSLGVEISACLGKLKKHHGTLTPIVPERKYFEMKDLIILYELKLKKFKEGYETKNRVNDLKSNSNSLSNPKFIIKTPIRNLNNNQKINGFRLNKNEQTDNVPRMNQNKQHKIYISQRASSFNPNILKPSTNELYKNPSSYSGCEHNEFSDNPTTETSLKKKIETSDKSTATMNDIATQTNEMFSKFAADSSILSVINEKTIKTQSASKFFTNKKNEPINNNVVYRTYLKKSKFSKYKRKSDGKKLLLEAYLRNNENLTKGGSTTSSGKAASFTFSVLHANKKVSSLIKNDAKNTHESGIGTSNDDVLDSLQSIKNEYDLSELKHVKGNEQTKNEKENESYYDTDLFAYFKPRESNNNNNNNNKNNKKIKNSDIINENSNTNLIRQNDLYAKKEKLLKKKVKQKKESYTKLRDAIFPNDNDVRGQLTCNCFKSSKPKGQEVKEKEELLKRIFAIIFYSFPLGLLFLLVIFYFFVQYLNPSCCDYHKNYLVWNII